MAEAAYKLGDSSESHFVYYLGSIKLIEKVRTSWDEILNLINQFCPLQKMEMESSQLGRKEMESFWLFSNLEHFRLG
jgi:hypothetical protein